MRFVLFRWAIASLLAITLTIGLHDALGAGQDVPAQDTKTTTTTKEPTLVDKKFEVPFWHTDEGLQVQASAQCFAAWNPQGLLGVMGARVLASNYTLFRDTPWQFRFDKVLPLDARVLELLKDERKLPVIDRKEIKELPLADRAWYVAFLQALRRSDQSTLEMFKSSAEENKDVSYAKLASKPEWYRGRVLTVTGKLTSIEKYPSPRYLNLPELPFIYTSWIIGPKKGIPPYTIVFTEMPKELDVSDKLNAQVTFHGYFLSFVRYPADQERGVTKTDLLSPYLVGKTLMVNEVNIKPVEVKDDTPHSYYYIAFGIGGLVLVVILGAALNIWFRRGDRRIHSQLQEVRDRNLPFNLEADSGIMEPPPKLMDEPNGNGPAPPPTT